MPTTREQAFVLLALHTLRRPCAGRYLEELYGGSGASLADALETLLQNGTIQQHDGTDLLFEAAPLPDSEVERLAALVRIPVAGCDNSHLLGLLHPGCSLDDCDVVLKCIMDQIHERWPTNMNMYVELVYGYLSAWAASHTGESGADNWKFVNLVLVAQGFSMYTQHNLQLALELGATAEKVAVKGGNERLSPFLYALRLYLISLSRYPSRDELRTFSEQAEALSHLRDPALDRLMPWLWSMQAFMRGEYQQVVELHHRTTPHPHWWYRRLFSIQAMNTLYSANYTAMYHLAAGISESARNTAVLEGKSLIALGYRVQHCFLLLRIGEFEKVRNILEYVTQTEGYASSNVLRSLYARILALYHYMKDDVPTAHSVLNKGVRLSLEKSMGVSPFHDPIIMDMLYVFEQKGYPPIPRYGLDSILDAMEHAANTHLRGAALRIRALRERDRGATPEKVSALLRESLQKFVPSGDPRELALTTHELARSLEHMGQHEEAAQLRNELATHGNLRLDPDADYRQASVICLKVSASFVTTVAGRNPERTAAALAEQESVIRCHQAFHAFPVHEKLEDMCHALVKIAQVELGAEQAALLVLDEKGQLLCKGAANLTPAELQSERMHSCTRWLQERLRGGTASQIHPDFGLCLLLDVDGVTPWALYAHNHMTEGLFNSFSQGLLREMARLFAAELRSCLRMDKVRDATISNQYARLKNIVAMREEGSMPPLLGEGLKTLMHKALQVSSTDAPILLWGETGVGKEVLARQIHDLSECPGPFIAIHPASMPETLFESECFGYERGAFTGAGKQKIGLFELADRGTLFIDEIGEISPLIQTKLLRVLQEKRFMRVGGTHEMTSRFRLVTATNRDLWQEVLEGRFRQDLLYRISVVPLKIPALRERRQDILPLAATFIAHFSRYHGKQVAQLTATQKEQLCAHTWPGNIRELRNVIERAVILHESGSSLHFELTETRACTERNVPESRNGDTEKNSLDFTSAFAHVPTLSELEAQYLRHILQQCHGRVLGPKGAAALLHMKPPTLYAKLHKYGIALREKTTVWSHEQ